MLEGERRLAAIMFTDLVGYTSLSQRNESLALRLLENHSTLLRSIFPKYGGNEIKTVGDSFLVEFSSSLEAVKCAIAIQKSVQEQNSRRAGDERVLTRIGLHLGDVVHSGHDVYGDDINIASRIVPLAQPGGICVTEQVFAQVRNKLEYPLISVGHIGLKNVDLPLEVYIVSLPWTPYPSAGPVYSEEVTSSATEAFANSITNYLARSNTSKEGPKPKIVTKLAIKNGIVDVELLNDPEIPPALGKFSSEVDYGRAETFRVVTGVESVKVIIDSSNLNKLLALIPKKNVKKIVGNLAEIVASEPEWILETPGVVATMSNELFENGVNLREFLTCSPATIIVVDEKHAWKAYEALRRLQ